MVYGEPILLGEVIHDGSYEFPLVDEIVPRFDEEFEPCMAEDDTFRAGFDKHTGKMIFVVEHANGDSASFARQRDLFDYQADRYYPDAAGELPLEIG